MAPPKSNPHNLICGGSPDYNPLVMDDQQTYLLNGLLARHFNLGRIIRFRPVQRGREAHAFELFTAQEKQYLVQIFPPAYPEQQLNFAADTVNRLDQHRFSVMPFLLSKSDAFCAEGPQGSHMLVSLAPAGSALEPDQYTLHDISQLGLRLAWLHRLLGEQLVPPPKVTTDLDRLQERQIAIPTIFPGLLGLPCQEGWAHGDIQLSALLHDGDHQLRAMMDWGLLHWGCPLTDLIDAFIEIAFASRTAGDRARGVSLLEAYDSLSSIRRTAWTPVVARWCVRRLVTQEFRPLPPQFDEKYLAQPERLATAIASCL
jgi:hypothetical protein